MMNNVMYANMLFLPSALLSDKKDITGWQACGRPRRRTAQFGHNADDDQNGFLTWGTTATITGYDNDICVGNIDDRAADVLRRYSAVPPRRD